MTVPRGGLYGFIGPNGAGKTTSIRIIMSILFPDSGELKVLGRDSALDAKDKIGYLPEERGVYRKMRVAAYLGYIARLKGVPEKGLAERVSAYVARVGLAGVEGKRCEELSKGMLQKIQFVAAIIHEPDLLILDEPFSGLDPVSMRQLREQIVAEHARGATILFSTHVMQQAEEICDHVVMIHRGRKVLDDPVSSIRSRYDPRALVLEPLDANADVGPVRALADVTRCERHEGAYHVELKAGVDAAGGSRGSPPCCRWRNRSETAASRGRVRADRRGRRRVGRRGARVARRARGPKRPGGDMSKVLQIAAREFVATVLTRRSSSGCSYSRRLSRAVARRPEAVRRRPQLRDRGPARGGRSDRRGGSGDAAPPLTKGTPAADLADVIRAARGEALGGNVLEALGVAPSSRCSSGRPQPTPSRKVMAARADKDSPHLALAVIHANAVEPRPNEKRARKLRSLRAAEAGRARRIGVQQAVREAIIGARSRRAASTAPK